MVGFLMPPVVWLLTCWGMGLWGKKAFIQIALSPNIIIYVVGSILSALMYLNKKLGRIDNYIKDEARSVSETIQGDIAVLPKRFILTIGIYTIFLPAVSMAGKPFLSSTDFVLGEVMAMPILLTFSTPIFLEMNKNLAKWTSRIPVTSDEKFLGLKYILFLCTAGVASGFVIMFFVAFYILLYKYAGIISSLHYILKIRILAVLVIETTLAFIIGIQVSVRVTRPIVNIMRGIRNIAEHRGDNIEPLNIESRDEIGHLVFFFNNLIDTVQETENFKKIVEEDRDIIDVYNRLYRLLEENLGFYDTIIYEVNNSKNYMSLAGVRAESKRWCTPGMMTDVSLCRAVRTARPADSFKSKDICMSFSQLNKNYICLPVIVGGIVINVIHLCFEKGASYTEIKPRVEKLQRLLDEIGHTIQSKRLLRELKESTLRDPLTGLYNRRFLEEYVNILVSSAQRKGTKIGIMMCDIDHFKRVNDQYGHETGDKVLREIATVMKSAIRASDLAVRYGGEEFLLILNDVDPEEVINIAERTRRKVEVHKIEMGGKSLSKTISIGVSVFPLDSENFWKCQFFADIALYMAKNRGRNNVVRFETPMVEGTSVESEDVEIKIFEDVTGN